jgi:hypothetical protein
MAQYVPTLVQVSRESSGADEPRYVCDPECGLLYSPGDVIPAIDRVLEQGGEAAAQANRLQTWFTKADADPFDPDVVRSGTTGWLAHLDTDVQKVAPDPDVIRAARTQAIPSHEVDP